MKQTDVIAHDNLRYRHLNNRSYTHGDTKPLAGGQEIMVLVRGITEKVVLNYGTPSYIGRFHLDNDVDIALDLSPYGAERCGVSRVHARFNVDRNNHLYISDMDSTNGTMVSGYKVIPFQPVLVPDEADIVLGNLLMKIYFSRNGS